MSPTLTTFLFEAVNFLVLAGVLGWLFFNPVRRALEQRRQKLEDDAQQAQQQLADAQAAQQRVDEMRSGLQQELATLRERELVAARSKAEEIVADARQSAERELELARRQAAQLSDGQRDSLAQASAIAAGDIVEQLLQQLTGVDLQTALVEAACRQLEALPQQNLSPVKVESAEDLSPAQRATLDRAMGPAAGTADYRTVHELGAGVRIATAQGLIDATVSGLSHYARRALLRELNHRGNNHNPLQMANHHG